MKQDRKAPGPKAQLGGAFPCSQHPSIRFLWYVLYWTNADDIGSDFATESSAEDGVDDGLEPTTAGITIRGSTN